MPKRCLLRLAGVLMLGLFSAIAASGSAQEVGPPVKLTPGEAGEVVDDAARSVLAAEREDETSAAEVDESAVQIATLGAVDPSSIGLLDESEGGFGIDMWLGTERALVEHLLPRLPVGTLSRPMQDLARRLLLSTARVPAGDAIAPSLLGLRVERLSAGGDTVAVNELLRLAPARLQDRAFARARIDGQLLAGNHAEACAAYKALVGEDPDNLYWLKGLTFCKALNGDQAAVRFAVDLLHEIGQDEDTAFLSLIASLSGDAEAQVASLVDPLPLHLAMLQVARLPVPANAVPGAPPAILRAIAKAPNAALDVRLAAAERAEAAGALSAEALAEIYKGVLFTPSEIAAALSLAREEPGPRANALLYQAGQIQRIPVLRAQALQLAWQLGHEQGRFGTAARVNRDATLDIEPSPDLAWFAADAVRALLAAGEAEAAFRWFRLAQQMATPSEPEAAMAVLEVWPLMFLAKPSLGKGWNPEIALSVVGGARRNGRTRRRTPRPRGARLYAPGSVRSRASRCRLGQPVGLLPDGDGIRSLDAAVAQPRGRVTWRADRRNRTLEPARSWRGRAHGSASAHSRRGDRGLARRRARAGGARLGPRGGARHATVSAGGLVIRHPS